MLPADKDPIGHAISDFFNGDAAAVIHVKSDIDDDDVIPGHYLFRSLATMPELEKTALVHCKGRVLDVGAAAGSHALVLQELGNQVTAIDISGLAVEVMKKRKVEDARCIDFFEFKGETFDTLLLLMNGIGITGNLQQLELFLKHARELLNPDGQIIFDSADLIDLYTEEDGSVRLDMDRPYYGEVMYQMRYNEIEGLPFRWLYVDFASLVEIAAANGFRCEKLYSDDDFNAYLARLTRA